MQGNKMKRFHSTFWILYDGMEKIPILLFEK